MPNTKLTREKLKIHFHYSKLAYVIVILAAVMIGNITYTVTEYRAPNARRIDIELVGAYAETSTDACAEYEERLLATGQQAEREADKAAGIDVDAEGYAPALEVVHFLSLEYDNSSTTSENYYALQKYMVTLAAQEGDIYVLSRPQLIELIESNSLVPLDDYIERGVIDPGERNLDKVTFDAYDDEGKATGETHIYALQAETLLGLYDMSSYVPTDKYMVILQFSENQDTAAVVLQEMINLFETTGDQAANAEGN